MMPSMKLIRLISVSLLLVVSSSTSAAFFGPSDPAECYQKYAPKVRLQDALNVIRSACIIGYDDQNSNSASIKASRCIVRDSAEMFSYESTKKIINKCSQDLPWAFNFFNNKLMANVNDAAEEAARIQRFNQRRTEDAIRDSQGGPVSIFDATTGTYKNCIKTGNQLNCF